MPKELFKGSTEAEGYDYKIQIVPVFLDDILIYYSARINGVEFYRAMMNVNGEWDNTYGQVNDLSNAIGKAVESVTD